MIIFIGILLMVVLSRSEFMAPNTFNNDYMSIRHTNIVKGIFVILVFCGHVVTYIQVNGALDKPYFTMKSHIVQMVVSMFLFYSGYGMLKSIQKKRFSYIRTLPIKRLLIVVINFDIAVLLFCIMNQYLGNHFPIKTILLSLTGWVGVGNSNWYMFVIFMLYILLFVSFYFLRWWDKKEAVVIGQLIFTMLSIAFVYWEIRMGQPTWFYDTVILFAVGGWYALLQEYIERVLMRNDSLYLVAGAVLAVLYWISFQKRGGGIEYFSIWAIFFTMAVVMFTMKLHIRSHALEWIGQHVFSLYILQRLPMNFMTKMGYLQESPYAFVVLCFLITIGLSVVFDFVVGKIDGRILQCLLREKNR